MITLSYGGGASQTIPINVNYQVTSGESYSAVIGYMRPVSAADRSYAVSNINTQVNDPQNVTWQASQNNNTLGSNGNGGSNDSYQIFFNEINSSALYFPIPISTELNISNRLLR
ncbi:hypothetical protein [Limosilactobacillus balticus]|uniref:hypothetical protein n=1 Tax=Limosilactobacillus balticus TaxID=2759747 RepID=UPI001E44F6D2|nr:hypothetical protein [Limosilactobacillus balticus]MCD7131466.1 hypothetical protein [Limosilactobacillus balticus]